MTPEQKPLTPEEWIAYAKILAEQFNIPADEVIQAGLGIRYGVRISPEKAKELANG